MKNTIEKDYAYCENIIQQNSKSFYRAFSSLPQEKAQTIYAVYAFCRVADDLADVKQDAARLSAFKTDFESFKAGNGPDAPMWRALAHSFEHHGLDPAPFDDMLTGQAMDLNFKQPTTQNQLENYCYYVAGSVGLMILPVLSKHHHLLKEKAIELGKAMQLTNILRDIGEDMDRGRLYLPKERIAHFGYSQEEFEQKKITSAFIRLWEYEAARAETLYKSALDSLLLFDTDSQMPILLSATLYSQILDTIRENGYDCFTKRAVVPKAKQLFLYQKIIKIFQKEKDTHHALL